MRRFQVTGDSRDGIDFAVLREEAQLAVWTDEVEGLWPFVINLFNLLVKYVFLVTNFKIFFGLSRLIALIACLIIFTQLLSTALAGFPRKRLFLLLFLRRRFRVLISTGFLTLDHLGGAGPQLGLCVLHRTCVSFLFRFWFRSYCRCSLLAFIIFSFNYFVSGAHAFSWRLRIIRFWQLIRRRHLISFGLGLLLACRLVRTAVLVCVLLGNRLGLFIRLWLHLHSLRKELIMVLQDASQTLTTVISYSLI